MDLNKTVWPIYDVHNLLAVFSLLKQLSLLLKYDVFFLFRHRATSTTAMAAMSPTCASPTVTPISSPWVERTPASFSGGWWEAWWATAGRDWPRPRPPAPALQNRPPARKHTVMSTYRGELFTHRQRRVGQRAAG